MVLGIIAKRMVLPSETDSLVSLLFEMIGEDVPPLPLGPAELTSCGLRDRCVSGMHHRLDLQYDAVWTYCTVCRMPELPLIVPVRRCCRLVMIGTGCRPGWSPSRRACHDAGLEDSRLLSKASAENSARGLPAAESSTLKCRRRWRGRCRCGAHVIGVAMFGDCLSIQLKSKVSPLSSETSATVAMISALRAGRSSSSSRLRNFWIRSPKPG